MIKIVRESVDCVLVKTRTIFFNDQITFFDNMQHSLKTIKKLFHESNNHRDRTMIPTIPVFVQFWAVPGVLKLNSGHLPCAHTPSDSALSN